MNLEKYHHIYFIGIGGIGMSALARYFKSRGCSVEGYDKTPSRLTDSLQKEGINVHFIDSIGQISHSFKDIEQTLVVYTPAIPTDNEQLQYFTKNNFDVEKRARVLAAIAGRGKSIAVAGTHGKTTTSSLITHIYNQKRAYASAFLGGISKNSETNFTAGSSDVVILEADEFDRSFHHLQPYAALITSMDADHLDIYGTEANIKEAFREFAKRVKPEGKLVSRHDLNLGGTTYGFDTSADYYATDIRVENGQYHFTLHLPNGNQLPLKTGMPGRHNVENAVGAAAICLECGLSIERISSGIETFQGVARRFDVRLNKANHIYIDDYAHHPEEIKAFLASVREMYPGKKMTAIFQPHLFSRTHDFATGFAKELSAADVLILMEIYPAREKPLPGITADWLMEMVQAPVKMKLSAKEIQQYITREKPELLLTIGAGDIDRLVEPISRILS